MSGKPKEPKSQEKTEKTKNIGFALHENKPINGKGIFMRVRKQVPFSKETSTKNG